MQNIPFKAYVSLLVGFMATTVSVLIIANWAIDPFDIFHTHFLKKQFQRNERFIKIELLEKNPAKYNSYLLGSSRMGTTNPQTIERYIQGSKFYNLNFSVATMYDHLHTLKYFLSKGFLVHHIYLQLDADIFLTQFEPSPSDYLRKNHPHVDDNSLLGFYFNYLTIFPISNMKRKILINLRNEDSYIEMDESGRWFNKHTDKQVSQSPTEYIKNEKSFHQDVSRNVGINGNFYKNINALKDFKKICEENGIDLIVFMTPNHHKMMDSYLMEDYFAALKAIAEITDFWNFSGYNSVTNNDANYYEASHYRPLVADLIAARIFNDAQVAVPADFGVLVTKRNLLQPIDDIRSNMPKPPLAPAAQ